MPQVVLTYDFLKDLRKLPVNTQKKFDKFLDLFRENPKNESIQLHKLSGNMADDRVQGARLDQKYRVIVVVPRKGDTYLLTHVGNHDEAYAWAENKRFDVHPETGVLQIYSVQEVEERVQAPPVAPAKKETEVASTSLFERFSDDELYQAGVPRDLISAVRQAYTDDQLVGILNYLPADCADILIEMADGATLDQALERSLSLTSEVEAAKPIDPESFDNLPSQDPANVISVDDPELDELVSRTTIEDWRVYLHPSQRALVHSPFGRQILVNGAAGTGKTVVLLHRAQHIVRNRPEDRVLFLTYSGTLALDLRPRLRQLLGSEARRVDVASIYHFARKRVPPDQGVEIIRGGDRKWERHWNDATAAFQDSLPLDADELKREYFDVIELNGIANEDDYLTVPRKGRPRMSRAERKKSWQFFSAFRQHLTESRVITTEDSLRKAREYFESHPLARYPHVLVDEVQDMALEGLRLVRSVWDDTLPHSSFMLAGDGHQRLYLGGVPLIRAGIEARGRRSHRLKVNYRTTEQIRAYAHGLIEGLPADDLNDGLASVFGDRSVMSGPAPEVVACKDASEEIDAAVAFVQGLIENGVEDRAICITAIKPRFDKVKSALEGKGIPVKQLLANTEDNPREGGVRLGTVTRIKGLEFQAVAFLCAVPNHPITRVTDADRLDRGAIYVACTRARERLLITKLG